MSGWIATHIECPLLQAAVEVTALIGKGQYPENWEGDIWADLVIVGDNEPTKFAKVSEEVITASPRNVE